MQAIKYSTRALAAAALMVITVLSGCKKLIEIDDPIDTITTGRVFSTNEQAQSAMAGVYTKLINGTSYGLSYGDKGFAMGAVNIFTALSSDEYIYSRVETAPYYNFYTNKLTKEMNSSVTSVLWSSAFECIYGCNAIVEGIGESGSAALTLPVRNQLNGEAKFLRAFTYFYLTNLFGEVPLVLTIDFNKTSRLGRSPVAAVYTQIISDLTDAINLLPDEYPSKTGQRIRPNKTVAKALLARVSLYQKDYTKAAQLATDVISQSSNYMLEPDLNNVFLKGSSEAVWQLEHSSNNTNTRSATPEGALILPSPVTTGNNFYFVASSLLDAFESGDQRKSKWIIANTSSGTRYVPYKFKVDAASAVLGEDPKEYTTPIRLSELLLIRAEALLLGPAADKSGALEDVNTIRRRAGLTPDLSNSLTNEQVLAAIMHERQVELFGEWGNRWFDLKRTGKAEAVLSAIPAKQPWLGDYQLVYPIPVNEITINPDLGQNPRY
ncbi:MAG: RagB/SusD family nutrient uptake outer membrane protein [Pseudobacter sp.]|uniref:RagB/SusD family nutrient uptake outer membrane protein n=1 Tax=Pseudobacter sp. TaxID=2045420 RepID=UPI003F7E6FF7